MEMAADLVPLPNPYKMGKFNHRVVLAPFTNQDPTIMFLNLTLYYFLLYWYQSKSDEAVENTKRDIGIVGDDAKDFDGVRTFTVAPEIDTISVVPQKNIAKLVTAGKDIELLVGQKNDGESSLNVVAIKASIHLPVDHRMPVHNLTAQIFNNGSVPSLAQATFPVHIRSQ